jgi:hypothetical protein
MTFATDSKSLGLTNTNTAKQSQPGLALSVANNEVIAAVFLRKSMPLFSGSLRFFPIRIQKPPWHRLGASIKISDQP